jgi:hypothetical protein
MPEMPLISPSSDADWKHYYERKYQDADKQLKDLAWAYAHLLRFAMTGKRRDSYMLTQRVLRRLQYPRDADPIRAELANHKQYAGSILREADDHA